LVAILHLHLQLLPLLAAAAASHITTTIPARTSSTSSTAIITVGSVAASCWPLLLMCNTLAVPATASNF
jgi:hypothetical protein